MKKRFLSLMLATLMACGTFGVFYTVPNTVAAAEASTPAPTAEAEDYVAIVDAALVTKYESAQDKLDRDANMKLVAVYGNYQLYANTYTGEVAFRDSATGQVLLSNPYNVPSYENVATTTRKELLSQIALGYTDNGVSKTFYSYTEAAARGQITVSNIKNGVRLNYALGRTEANYLAPGMITEVRMIEMILSVMIPDLDDYSFEAIFALKETSHTFKVKQFLASYTLYNLDRPGLAQATKDEYLKAYPILETLRSVYVRNSSTPGDLRRMENYIKEFCPEYTYEEMEKDHAETKYVSDELDPPLFKLALEYTLDAEGLNISLPANGIRFNYELYQLEYITPLQYFGAGDLNTEGYLFYPDGSGAIFYYEDLLKKSAGSVTGKVYGADYAYHQISGQHQEVIRMPVYGAVNTDAASGKKTGYLAILDEGNATANLTAAWGGSVHSYASVYPTFYPRARDSYDLSDSMSVGSVTTWSVEASRKYTGNYKMRIVMLSDVADRARLEAVDRNYFEASYVGMAKAYSHYLVDVTKTLSPLSASDVKDGEIPLYIESFGTVPDIERILSIPVNVNVPLTTFDDVYAMYKELAAHGISNVQFKLTGFANGGMYYTYPNRLDFMNEVGGADGFRALLEKAKQEGFGLYPDFDFMYIVEQGMFDGVDLKYAAARTIDNRYSSRRVYDVTYQEFVSYFDLCVTPVMIEEYYAKFTGAYSQFNPMGISVSTLGSDLNSDFGERVPTNREDAKNVIGKVFSKISKDYGSVMTSGGNVYALAETNHLLAAALDSSRFASASRSVPFVGIVLHGYVNFSGSAINMAGNYDYEVLKAIENGASVYFTLSYRNTNLLKEFEDLSQYYSVNYKIWAGTYDENGNLVTEGDLFEVYNRVNDAIGHLQTSKIVDHRFLIGERVASEAEIAADAALVAKAMLAAEEAANDAAKKAQIAEKRQQLAAGLISPGEAIDAVATDEQILAIFESYNIKPTTTTSEATDGDDYVKTKYSLDDGKLVLVTYEGGHAFILNYNFSTVTVKIGGATYTLEPYGYQPIQL